MGMGEPLYNYENVIKTLNVLTDEKGLSISKRKITLYCIILLGNALVS